MTKRAAIRKRARRSDGRLVPTDPVAAAALPARHRGGFQKGKSGNPGGMPKGVKLLRDRIGELTNEGQDVIQFHVDVMNGNAGKVLDTPGARMDAAAWLGDRYFGKVKQTVDVNGGAAATPEQLAAVFALQLSPHERRSRIAELKARAIEAESSASSTPDVLANGHADGD